MISVNQLIRLLGRQNPDALVVVAQDDQPETQANDITGVEFDPMTGHIVIRINRGYTRLVNTPA